MHTKTPKLCRHKSRQQGYVTLNAREHYLGHWPVRSGKKPPPAVQARYDELVARWLANHRQPQHDRPSLSVNELLLSYLEWAKQHYVPRRAKDDQNRFIRYAATVVRDLFGRTDAADFGPKKLRLVQQAMIDQGWCRSTVNSQVDRVRRMFKWAVAEELVPGSSYHAAPCCRGNPQGYTPGSRNSAGSASTSRSR